MAREGALLAPGLLHGSVLATKVARPRVPPTFVRRDRVRDLLDSGVTRQLTMVSAGAGWGKTLAAADWAAALPAGRRPAWLSLDSGDNSSGRFWSGVLSAVRQSGASPDIGPLATLSPLLGDPESNFQGLLGGLVELTEPMTLVLDDFHVVQDPVILAQVAELLRQRPPMVTLILLTRSDPPLPLHRLRLADELLEIRPRDLAFGPAEAETLLGAHRVGLAPGDADRLVERTEGWAAGLRLAALFLERGDLGRDVDEFTGTDRVVSAYLADEVLAGLAPGVRDFLLRTSVVDRVNSGLAEALSGQPDAQQRLETLEETNAFVVGLGADRQWFRYHALLREMLQHRLLVDDPGSLPELHTRAAAWYAGHDHPVQALQHAAEAQNWDLVGELFVTQGCPLLVSPARDDVARVLGRIPAASLNESVNLLLCGAAQEYTQMRFGEMAPLLALTQEAMRARPHEASPSSQLTFMLLSQVVARHIGDVDALLRAAQGALHLVPVSGVPTSSAAAFRSSALANLGTAHLWAAELDETREFLSECLEVADRSGVEMSAINARSHLALAAALQDRLAEAERLGTAVVDLAQSRGWALLPQAAMAYVALALVALKRYDLPRARDLIEVGRKASSHEPIAHYGAGLVQVSLAVAQSDLTTAAQHLDRLRGAVGLHSLPRLLASWVATTEAELQVVSGNEGDLGLPAQDEEDPFFAANRCLAARQRLAQGDAEGAESLLAALRDPAARGHDRVDVWLWSALVASRLREDRQAVEHLQNAVRLADPQGVRLPFFLAERTLLIQLLIRIQELGPESEIVDDLLDLLGLLREPELPSTYEPLTDRELIVLEYLPTMMTNAEIAERLFVSVNTVKAHLKSIFRKLDVSSRRQAVQRAKELGLSDRRSSASEV